MTAQVPPVVRGTGVLVVLEGVIALMCAVAVVVAGVRDADARVTFGTAGMFVLIGVAVVAAGWALWRGRRWGRGVAVVTQLLLLPVAWYFLTSSQPAFGVPLGLVALITLALLFSGPALKWAVGQSDSARSDNAGPDTR